MYLTHLCAFADCCGGRYKLLTWHAGQLEVRGSREGHRWNSQCVNLRGRLHRGSVLRWGREINLILKVVIKFLTDHKSHLKGILVTTKKSLELLNRNGYKTIYRLQRQKDAREHFTHLKVDLLLFAAGSTVEQQNHEGHQHSQRQQQRDDQREIHISSSLCWTHKHLITAQCVTQRTDANGVIISQRESRV